MTTIRARCRAVGFEPRVAQEAIDMDSVVGLVSAGYGVAVVPASVAGRRPHDVTFNRLIPADPPIELALAVPDRPPSPAAERFVALARHLGPVRL